MRLVCTHCGILALCALVGLMAGCRSKSELEFVSGQILIKSGDEKERFTPDGKKLFDFGEPPEAAKITFFQGTTPVAVGFTDERGYFRMLTGVNPEEFQDGVKPGVYRVTVREVQRAKKDESGEIVKIESQAKIKYRKVPPRYDTLEGTDLVAVVVETDGPPTDVPPGEHPPNYFEWLLSPSPSAQ